MGLFTRWITTFKSYNCIFEKKGMRRSRINRKNLQVRWSFYFYTDTGNLVLNDVLFKGKFYYDAHLIGDVLFLRKDCFMVTHRLDGMAHMFQKMKYPSLTTVRTYYDDRGLLTETKCGITCVIRNYDYENNNIDTN
jgi:hypothetical protein